MEGSKMRKFFAVLLVTAMAGTTPAAAKAPQCLLCGVLGFVAGSALSSDQAGGTTGGNLLYVAPRIAERLKVDPLEARVVAMDDRGFSVHPRDGRFVGGKTLREYFAVALDEGGDPAQYTILQVQRVIGPSSPDWGTLWFVYIEKEKLTPLDELPEPAN